MPEIEHFHETRFPLDISLGAIGGPVRRTEVVSLVSGHEKRNTKWADSRRSFNAGFGVKTLDDLQTIIAFFEERRGRLFGFRFRDPIDFKSCLPSQAISEIDQEIGTGDGAMTKFHLTKSYGIAATSYRRNIRKPVKNSVVVAIDAALQFQGTGYTLDDTTGEILFLPGAIPAQGTSITAGFEFDLPVRFDSDEISINLGAFKAGDIPSIPLIEIKS